MGGQGVTVYSNKTKDDTITKAEELVSTPGHMQKPSKGTTNRSSGTRLTLHIELT